MCFVSSPLSHQPRGTCLPLARLTETPGHPAALRPSWGSVPAPQVKPQEGSDFQATGPEPSPAPALLPFPVTRPWLPVATFRHRPRAPGHFDFGESSQCLLTRQSAFSVTQLRQGRHHCHPAFTDEKVWALGCQVTGHNTPLTGSDCKAHPSDCQAPGAALPFSPPS